MWGEVRLGGWLVETSQAKNWPLLKLDNGYIGGEGGVIVLLLCMFEIFHNNKKKF